MVAARMVVGVDGSAPGLAAVEGAVREARLRKAGLRVVHAYLWPAMHPPPGPLPLGPPEGGVRSMIERLLAQAVERARTVAPEVQVSNAVVTGEPLTVLEAQSRAAELVVGSRGMGGFRGLLAGSTAVHLAAYGRCPVLVVREEPRAHGPVVMGADCSAAREKAVDFASAEAALYGTGLVALHAWSMLNAPMPAAQDASVRYADRSGAECFTSGGRRRYSMGASTSRFPRAGKHASLTCRVLWLRSW